MWKWAAIAAALIVIDLILIAVFHWVTTRWPPR
jgi:hypothetical protein